MPGLWGSARGKAEAGASVVPRGDILGATSRKLTVGPTPERTLAIGLSGACGAAQFVWEMMAELPGAGTISIILAWNWQPPCLGASRDKATAKENGAEARNKPCIFCIRVAPHMNMPEL